MMRALFLNCSPHGAASHGYRLDEKMIATLHKTQGLDAQHLHLIARDLVAEPLPVIGKAYATAITSNAAKTATVTAAFEWSERLIGELEQTDLLVITRRCITSPCRLR